MRNLRDFAFYIIIVAWLSLLGIVCGILISPLPYDMQTLAVYFPPVVAAALLLLAMRIYSNLNSEDKIFLRHGAFLTAISALTGNLIFLIIDNIKLIIITGLDFVPISMFALFLLLELSITSFITVIPSFAAEL